MNEITVASKIGAATGFTMLAAGTLDGGNVSVTTAATCCVFVGGCVWWLAKRFQAIDDRLNSMAESIRFLPCKCPNKEKE